MDKSANTGFRTWLLSAAAAGLVAPGVLSGQDRPAPGTPSPTSKASGSSLVAETEVEQQLRLLYERDGREMPELRLTQSPATQRPQATAAPMQPRYSAVPAAPAPQTNRLTSFFKRMMPGGSKPAPTQSRVTPPRQLPPVPPQARTQPTATAPMPMTPNPAGANGAIQHSLQPAAPQPSAQTQMVQPIAPSPAAQSRAVGDSVILSEDSHADTRPNATAADEEFVEDDLEDWEIIEEPTPETGESLEMPVEGESAPIESGPPQLDDDFPNPFGGASEADVDQRPIEEPYTGRSLNDESAPAALPAGENLKEMTDSADEDDDDDEMEEAAEIAEEMIEAEEPTAQETAAQKMRRILQRTDVRGLKGFCPVTLRDRRELADARPEFVGSYRGQKFYFASQAAQAKFEHDPARYAPAAYGADVVVLIDQDDIVEGSLDHAAWYKGRLYLFGSEQTHHAFVAEPEKYATPPGID